jgi:hypothetical protein
MVCGRLQNFNGIRRDVNLDLLKSFAQDRLETQKVLARFGRIFHVNHHAPQIVLVASALVNPDSLNHARLK